MVMLVIEQAIMKKFEYFPIRCRADRAMELYTRLRQNSGDPGILGGVCSDPAKFEVKKPLKSKVLSQIMKIFPFICGLWR